MERIRRLADAGGGSIDADTVMSAGSFVAAQHAAGGAIELVDRVLGGAAPTGFSVHRPPGHHATADRAMGFCLFNNVAVAARWALDHHGLERVMIVDYDVHHGNGTNDIFAADPRVLFVSVHESPLYPGTGPATDVGSWLRRWIQRQPAGRVRVGRRDVRRDDRGDRGAAGAGVCAAAAADLGRVRCSPRRSAGDLHGDRGRVRGDGRAAARCGRGAGVPVAGVLEGGYGLDGLARSLRVSMEALAAPAGSPVRSRRGAGAGSAGAWTPTVRGARARVAKRWPALADG